MHCLIDHKYAQELTNSILNFTNDLEKKSKWLIKIIYEYQDLLECIETNTLAVVLHFEGAEATSVGLGSKELHESPGCSVGVTIAFLLH